jgi:hypothetical protein
MRSHWVVLILSPGFLTLLLLGCNPPPTGTSVAEPEDRGPPWFEDITDKVGIDFVHDAGPPDDTFRLPQIIGSGVALFDCDGDGLLDLYFVSNGGPMGRPSQLYRQKPGGTFENVSKDSGLGCSSTRAVGSSATSRRTPASTTLPGGPRPPSSTTTATASSTLWS